MSYFDRVIDRNHTKAYKLELRKKIFGRDDVLPLWVADMDFASPREVSEVIQQRAAHEIYGYTIRDNQFPEAVAGWMLRRHHWDVPQSWIEYAPGVVPSLVMAILAFTNPGDQVMIQTPVYPPFFSVVKDNNRELIRNPLVEQEGQYSIDFDLFEKQASDPKLKMVILSHPHNPVSRVWTRDELLRMAEICLKHQVLIVSDEIHSDLMLFGHQHIPIASLSDEIAQNTITCMAASKTFNIAGFSTSFVIIPNRKTMVEYKRVLQSLHLYTGNMFGGIATEAAYNYGEPWLCELLKYIEGNVEFVRRFLAENMPEIKVTPPQATFLLWLDFRAWGMTQMELKEFLVNKAKVGLNDGTSFGDNGVGFMRLNVASPRSVIEEGLNRIGKARSW